MKKLNFLSILLSALLVSSSMWAGKKNLPVLNEAQPFGQNLIKSEGVFYQNSSVRKLSNDEVLQQIRLQYGSFDSIFNSLQVAFNNLPQNSTPATVTLLSDVFLAFEGSGLSVGQYQNVTLDLNDHVVYGTTEQAKASVVLTNNGTLTIIDSGAEGKGKLTNQSANPDVAWHGVTGGCPAYANNTITNYGTLIIKGGTIENTTTAGGASYPIDCAYNTRITIDGGKIINTKANYAVRMLCYNGYDNVFNLVSGSIESAGNPFWIQLPSSTKDTSVVAHLNVSGGKIISRDATYHMAVYTYSYGSCSNKINIKVLGGELDGSICIGGGKKYTNDYVQTQLMGGKFVSVDNFKTYNTSYGYPDHATISGGTYKVATPYWYEYWSLAELEISYPNNPEYATKEYWDEGTTWDVSIGYYVDDQGIIYKYYDPVVNLKKHVINGYCIDYETIDATYSWATIVACDTIKEDQGGTKTWTEKTDNPTSINDVDVSNNTKIIITPTEDATSVDVTVNKINLTGEGQIHVKDGATLTVGGGIETDNTILDPIIVEPGGTLVVGGNGVTNEGTRDILIKGDDGQAGVMLFDPNTQVDQTQVEATVDLYTYSKTPSGKKYWQIFATPVTGLSAEKVKKDIPCGTMIYAWDYDKYTWKKLNDWSEVSTPFAGYDLCNNTDDGGVTYSFKGVLVGNMNTQLVLSHPGYCVMGNSYTAPFSVVELFNQIDKDMNNNKNKVIEKTVYIYNSEKQRYEYTNELEQTLDILGIVKAPFTTVAPMQGFLLNLKNGESAGTTLDYANAVFNCDRNNQSAYAPSRNAKADIDLTISNIQVNGVESQDRVVLVEGAEFSNEIENGKDAYKYMDDKTSMRLYANADGAKLAMVATDDLVGTTLAFQAGEESQYTLTFTQSVNNNYQLLDMQNGNLLPMTAGNSYSFMATPNSLNPSRFQIVSNVSIITGTEKVSVNGKVGGIYSVCGQFMGKADSWNVLPSGVYVVDGTKMVK